jgi:murein DD-endopeptidase MepM/ murein hydrolase activator NlpD
MRKEPLLRKIGFVVAAVVLLVWMFYLKSTPVPEPEVLEDYASPSSEVIDSKEIIDVVRSGETLFGIFKRYGLHVSDLLHLREAAANVYPVRRLHPDRSYRIVLDGENHVQSFTYWISDDDLLEITRIESGFRAEKVPVPYERRILHLGGIIENNLIESMGEQKENRLLAFQVSDIYAWDIDFTSDLRRGDSFKLVVEGLYLDGELRKYGDVLSAEFINRGENHRAYRFESDGRIGYYDASGKSLRRAFLKAPLNFRRISSTFSNKRFHPVLKIYRPHHGLDYAAPSGTPVSAVGDGTVAFSGWKGGYGKLVILKHPNGYKTYYGHLSRLGKGIRKGKRVEQGDVLGYVGATGRTTGPHLHYEVHIHDKPVNPLSIKVPRSTAIPEERMAEFRDLRNRMDGGLSAIHLPEKGLRRTSI